MRIPSSFWNLLTRLLFLVIGGVLGAILGWCLSDGQSFSIKTAEMIVGSFFAVVGFIFGQRVFEMLVRFLWFAP